MVSNKYFRNIHFQIVQSVNEGADLHEVLDLLIAHLQKIFKAASTHIALLKVDEENKHLIKLVGTPVDITEWNCEPRCGVYNYTKNLEKFLMQKVMINDVEKDTRWKNYLSIAKRLQLKSSWTIPVKDIDKQLLAVLSIGFKDDYQPDPRKIKIVEEYIHLITVSYELLTKGRQNYSTEKNWGRKKQKITLPSLRRALKNDEFTVFYQPYFSLKTDEVGVEALIRWNHPELGLLPPSSFLPKAEETGFIVEMEKWVLNQAISDITALMREMDKEVYLSVNISAKQLQTEEFITIVEKTIEKHSFQPKFLTLEITERFNIEESHIKVLEQLQQCGIRISIDDFGKSFSSLHYLKQLPLDELKLDREFIADIQANEKNKKIVEMIITLAHELNLVIVGEGVEEKSQLQMLKELNCDYVQGFLFSKPVPYENIRDRLMMMV